MRFKLEVGFPPSTKWHWWPWASFCKVESPNGDLRDLYGYFLCFAFSIYATTRIFPQEDTYTTRYNQAEKEGWLHRFLNDKEDYCNLLGRRRPV
jgi:hypothetical protein